jgi:hypothetical protein
MVLQTNGLLHPDFPLQICGKVNDSSLQECLVAGSAWHNTTEAYQPVAKTFNEDNGSVLHAGEEWAQSLKLHRRERISLKLMKCLSWAGQSDW